MDPLIPAENFNQLTATRYGPMLYNRHDLYVGRSLAAYGEWCEEEVALMCALLGPGDVVLDLGANIGAHTLPLARAVGPTGHVYAFEPQRIVYQTLCANLALNSLTNVHTYMMAIGAEPGVIAVPPLDYTQADNFGGLRLKAGSPAGEEVDVVTVDMLPLPGCRLIKIDVEEMELDVLRGAVQTLARFRPFLFVEANPGPLRDPLIRFLAAQDYAMFWAVTRYNHPGNFKGAAPIFPDDLYSFNMLAVHASIAAGLAHLERVEVPAEPAP